MPSTSAAQAKSIARFLARRLKELRSEKAWNLDQLQVRLGGRIARSTVGNVEAGARFPSVPALFALARAFDVPPAVILLDPARKLRDAVALTVLRADEASVRLLAAQLGVSVPSSR